MRTPLRYAGGKSKAYSLLSSHIPVLEKKPARIISPFIGGGSLESRWASELDIEVHAFDVFDVLVNFWQALLSNPAALYGELLRLEPTPTVYDDVKAKLMSWSKTQEMLKGWRTGYYVRQPVEIEPLLGAAYYYFNHNLSYGPMYLGWMSKIYQNKERWLKAIESIRDYRNPNLKVECASFDDVIPLYPNDFIYLDPPYYLDRDSDNKMFKGIYPNANIDVHHTGFDHEKLRDLLSKHQGRFMLSYNNCETIRKYYRGYRFEYPSWNYSYALGETRIGRNKSDNTPKMSHEILIIKD